MSTPIHPDAAKVIGRIAACWSKVGPDLLEACKAWMLVESEMRYNNPCPDLLLRANYRERAVKLTKLAIAKAEESTL